MKRLLVLLFVLGISFALDARLMLGWTFNQLRDEADLIVVATPTEVKETTERAPLPRIESVGRDGKESDVIGASIETTFQILTTLKGDTTLKSLVLHHYREAGEPGANGPI